VLRDLVVDQVNPNTDAGEDDPKPPVGKTGKAGRGTLLVTTTSLTFIGARGNVGALPADERSAMSYAINGSKLEGTATCPDKAARSISFSAVGKQLLFFVDATHREVYLRLED